LYAALHLGAKPADFGSKILVTRTFKEGPQSGSKVVPARRNRRSAVLAEREIAGWRERSGENFWQESDNLGGDHNYDAQIDNSAIVRLRIVEPTVVTVGITMRDGRLRCVTVIESTGWYPVASVWINEWFEETPNRLHVGGHNRPHDALVEFPSSLPDDEKSRPLQSIRNA
jgi:hypothetical protein